MHRLKIKFLLPIIFLLMVIFLSLFLIDFNKTYIIESGSIERKLNKISGSYDKFQGYLIEEVYFNAGDLITFYFTETTESGELQIQLFNEHKKNICVMYSSSSKQLFVPYSRKYNSRKSS